MSEKAAGDAFEKSIFYKGDVTFVLDKDTYLPGDMLKADITIQNSENFSLIDAYLIVNIVVGKEHIYPSDQSDENNVFYEKAIGGINLAPGYAKTIPFSYKLPEDLKGGSYLFEVYAETKRAPIAGIPFIFLSPKNALFIVGGSGDFPFANIVRTETVFNEYTGQAAAPVNASSDISGQVFIQNALDSKADYLLNVTMCSWDDILCAKEDHVSSVQYAVSLDPKQKGTIDVRLTAPEKSNAYSLRLELSKDGRTVSIYRNRIIVVGPTARIRKMALDSLFYQQGASGRIMLLIGASPDHYTLPEVVNAKVSFSISADGGEVYSDSSTILRLSLNNSELGNGEFDLKTRLSEVQGPPPKDSSLVPVFFGFISPQELRTFVLCAKIESSNGELYDSYCSDVDPSKVMLTENVFNVSWEYDYGGSVLRLGICGRDASGLDEDSNVSVFLLGSGGTEVDALEGLSLMPCGSLDLRAEPGIYSLLINDMQTNRQTSFGIEIEKKPVCGDGRCEKGESSADCCDDCGCLPVAEEKPNYGPVVYVGAAFLVLGAFIFFVRRKTRAK